MPWDESQRAWAAIALALFVVLGDAAVIILSHVL
jgi:hypothetical protein